MGPSTDQTRKLALHRNGQASELDRFADSYATFNRIINSLQRKYIELEDEFAKRNADLTAANIQLTELGERNAQTARFLNEILETVSAGVIAVDRDGVVTHCNQSAALTLGIRHESATGKSYRSIIPAIQPPDVSVMTTLETGNPVRGIERVVTLCDGATRYLTVSTSLLYDGESRVIGALELFHDMTLFRTMEREMVRLQSMAALGVMAAAVAHEVRNPLAGIAGFVSLLERDLDPSDPKRRLVSKIMVGVNNLETTVIRLLNYARVDTLQRVPTTVGALLRETIASFLEEQSADPKALNVKLTLEHRTAASELAVDQVLMKQVMANLLANAQDAMGGSGDIFVDVQMAKREARAVLATHLQTGGGEEDSLLISVRDTGTGISPADLSQVFLPYFSTKNDGTGLGLAMAQKIVRAHGGEIKVQSELGAGATFTIQLPLSHEMIKTGEVS